MDPDSYRRITVNSMIGKVVDKEMVPHIRKALAPNRSWHQFGFKKDISCINAGVMEGKDTISPIHVCYMGTSKAFDMVDHAELLYSLHTQGITGSIWHMYKSSYSNIWSVLKWDGEISEEFGEGHGIRHGGLASANVFDCKADPILHRLSIQPDGFKIVTTNVGAVMVADDLTLVARYMAYRASST